MRTNRITWIAVFALCLLVSPWVRAEGSLELDLFPSSAAGDEPRAVERPLIFYAPTVALDAGAHTLDVGVHVDGELRYRERLDTEIAPEVTAGAAEQPLAFELFAWSPVWAEALAGGSGDDDTVVSLVLDGGTAEVFTPTELVAETRQLIERGFVPLPTASELVLGSRQPEGHLSSIFAAAKDPACVNQCQAARDDCYDACGLPEDPMCLGYCEDEYDDCYGSCPSGCSGPTVTTYVEVTPLSVVQNYPPPLCFSPSYRWYNYVRVYEKVTGYRKTTQCDGSSTTVVIGVNYRYTDCWLESTNECQSAHGSSYNYFVCTY